MPIGAIIGGILKVVGKVAKVGSKVIAITNTAGGVVNTATTPYFSEAGQRVQAIYAGMAPPSAPVLSPSAQMLPQIKQVPQDDSGNAQGPVYRVDAKASPSGPQIPQWAVIGLLAATLLILFKRR